MHRSKIMTRQKNLRWRRTKIILNFFWVITCRRDIKSAGNPPYGDSTWEGLVSRMAEKRKIKFHERNSLKSIIKDTLNTIRSTGADLTRRERGVAFQNLQVLHPTTTPMLTQIYWTTSVLFFRINKNHQNHYPEVMPPKR